MCNIGASTRCVIGVPTVRVNPFPSHELAWHRGEAPGLGCGAARAAAGASYLVSGLRPPDEFRQDDITHCGIFAWAAATRRRKLSSLLAEKSGGSDGCD